MKELLIVITLVSGCGAMKKTGEVFDGDDKVKVEAEKGDPGKDGESPVDGKDGVDGKDSTIPGPQGEPGKDSTVPGKIGEPGKPGKDSTIPGPRGNDGIDSNVPGPQGEPGVDAEPCEVVETSIGYNITCNGNTVEVDTTKPESPEIPKLKICIWVNWHTIRTIMAEIEDINNDVYTVAHIGKCLFEGETRRRRRYKKGEYSNPNQSPRG